MNFGGIATMNGGGPMISGQWVNTKTGEHVTVRDSFMDGDDMVICLTNGRQLSLDQFQDYVQQSDSDNDNGINSGMHITQSNVKKNNVNEDLIFAGMDENKSSNLNNPKPDNDLLNELSKFDVIDTPVDKHIASEKPETASHKPSIDLSPIDKILEQTETPEFDVTLEWPEFPKDEFRMCKKYFNVTDDDIIEAIVNRYCTIDILKDALKKWLQYQN